MKPIEKKFFDTFTDFQCLILAHMNKGDINGITASHYNIIEFVLRKKGSTGKEIASAFKITPAAVSKQLKPLINNDFITQEQDETDRRKFILSATEKGKFVIENSETFRKKITRQTMVILSPAELEQFNNLLSKVLSEIKL
ncbi:MarR family transcriptional regulator [Chryseobacterium sp. StRB126]|uniref:MarR family winged helix-turn-helix transcriptional regulator n=1 Tax=Chryseobacterium sp. StRB126 TaxID=878220 RepID=UPI0004E98A0B|nr:MarR family winged helix-turn-helix transcriptional regulator [Chryseobacterium sp. StRB126]BAP31161.1 MarR family transcriptional regulator [Chryseobacterium sp. StRB126]